MNQKINSSKFEVTVGEILKEYGADTAKAMYLATDETLDEAVDLLKQAGQSHWKKFNRAWTKTITQHRLGFVEGYAHLKKPYYRIGHLLEFDHASRNGGRVGGFHFIEPIYQKVDEIFEKKMIQMMGENYDK